MKDLRNLKDFDDTRCKTVPSSNPLPTNPHDATKSTILRSLIHLGSHPFGGVCQGESEVWEWTSWSNRGGWWRHRDGICS